MNNIDHLPELEHNERSGCYAVSDRVNGALCVVVLVHISA